MFHTRLAILLGLLSFGLHAASPSLTIYNQDFAVVRDRIPLDLKKGVNDVVFDGATLRLEPDSVILRDAEGTPLPILEQNYRNNPVTQKLLLSLFEGKEIDFIAREQQKPDRVVKGRVIRCGNAPQDGNEGSSEQPIIEVDGKIQFSLPGEPLFPSLGDDTILKPRLDWKISSPKDLKTEAEVCYITGGMSWQASYNLVAPEHGEELDLVGWITMENRSGRDFVDAGIRLMAGDVNRIQPPRAMALGAVSRAMKVADELQPAVTEKSFDEYHLYTLGRGTTLKDRETKQVEFLHASGIKAETVYLYDGGSVDWNRWGGGAGRRIMEEDFGSEGGKKVLVVREFKNSTGNGLGIPLPKGRMRLYRSNGPQLEFTGEDEIDHTPSDEPVRITTGKAFDLVGERKRTGFQVNNAENRAEESFEITLRNRKKESVEIRVVEHLLRWVNWQIPECSEPFQKTNAQTVEFRMKLKPGEEKKLTYKVRYSW